MKANHSPAIVAVKRSNGVWFAPSLKRVSYQAAMEHVARLKERHEVEATVISVDPEDSDSMVRSLVACLNSEG